MTDEERKISDEGYKKVDRRVTADAETAAAAEAPPAEQPPAEVAAADQPAPDAATEQGASAEAAAGNIGVYGILRFTVSLLSQQAWISLGLQAPPGQETQTNLPEARVCIDTLSFVVEKLQPDLDEAEKKELQGLLANLRANYVTRL